MKKRILAIILLVILTPGLCRAIQPRDIPDFSVESATGEQVESAVLTDESQWLLIFIDANSLGQLRSLNWLEPFSTQEALAPRIVLIAGGGTKAWLDSITARSGYLAKFNWFFDPKWISFKALGVQGTPIALGIKDGRMEWAVAGRWDAADVQTLFTNWIDY